MLLYCIPGDLVPESSEGRATAAFAALVGIITIALPVGVVGNAFNEAFTKLKEERELKKKQRSDRRAIEGMLLSGVE